MTEKKIIAVVGATGSQGGGLVRAILADPDHEFAARVLTRSSQSGKARELAASGAEVVEADLAFCLRGVRKRLGACARRERQARADVADGGPTVVGHCR